MGRLGRLLLSLNWGVLGISSFVVLEPQFSYAILLGLGPALLRGFTLFPLRQDLAATVVVHYLGPCSSTNTHRTLIASA